MTAAQGRTVALTGATGFIGSAVTRALVDSGWRVRALLRNPARTRHLSVPHLEFILGDLDSPSTLQSLVDGTDAVVHCAGAVRGITQADFNRVNVAGTARLIAVASRLDPPPLFLSLSSLAARHPQLSPYAASKRAGEDALASGAGRMRWIALRPPAVYGPGDRELLPLFRWMMHGIAPVLGSPRARFSMLYVDDLATAIAQSVSGPARATGVFELHDGHSGGYCWDDIISIAAAQRGKRVRRIRISEAALRAMALLGVTWARMSGQAPMLTPGKVRELRHDDWVCDNREFSQAVGWEPMVQFGEGLRLTLAADGSA